jgi:hypothetical protein
MFMVVFSIALMFVLLPTRASADQDSWSVDVGGGTSPTTGDISSRLTTGWNVDFRSGYQFNNVVGLFGEVDYHHLGVANQVLQTLQVPDGNARMWSVTLGPTFRFPITPRLDGYLLGGIGWYRRTVEFIQPTVSVIDVIDPWWGYIGPVFVPANQVLGSVTKDAFGGNAGGGLSLGLGESGAAVFAEVSYHYANTKPTSTAIVPVNFGIRWTGRTRRP